MILYMYYVFQFVITGIKSQISLMQLSPKPLEVSEIPRIYLEHRKLRERSGSVEECLTRDRGAAGLSLTGVTALWSLSKTHLS